METVVEKVVLSDEQKKRMEILDAYQAETAPVREARNKALADHEAGAQEKWMAMQGELEIARAKSIERLRAEGRDDRQVASLVAVELAGMVEKHMIERELAARKLDLAVPKTWLEYLEERKQKTPEDPTLDSMIEEAKAAPLPALDGHLKNPPQNAVVSELMPRPGKDGQMDYMRGMLVSISDTGTRLDVKRSDDRDIEAALKIGAQKFDMEKGLMLTGDAAFKTRSAEIAGRLGYKLQNTEPEVLMAYKRGLEKRTTVEFARVPSVENGIAGDALDRAVAVLNGPAILRADPQTIKTLQDKLMPGIEVSAGETIVMPGERVMAANAEIRELPTDVLPILAEVDISKLDGGLAPEQIAKLAKEDQGLVEDGKLTQKAIDIVLVRDDRVIKSREQLSPEMRNVFGPVYRTSGDRVRETEQSRDLDRTNGIPEPEHAAALSLEPASKKVKQPELSR